jgi:LmbE family N-acetylglucosaminyl deacetylase
MKLRRSLALLLFAALAAATLAARAAEPLALEEHLARLPHWGTVVYVTAHPDDESAAIITYLARGLHCRVVILAMTRGEGGQNQDGPELSDEMAWVRTRELQAAAAGYGAEVRFLGAVDFGYSKSVEETFRVWDEPKVVGELVRQIRELRPIAVISHWSDQAPAGAHHQAAGILTRRGVPLAGDAKAYPEQLAHGLAPWQPRYFLLRSYNPEEGKTLPVPVDQPSPVAGKSYEMLGWEAFRSHRSQGMHEIDLSQVRFLRRYFLRVEDVLPAGVPAPTSVAELAPDLAGLPELFPSVRISSSARERLAQATELAGRARQLLAEQNRSAAARALVESAERLNAVGRELPPEASDQEARSARAWVEAKQEEFLQTAADLSGVRLNALADRAVLTPGETVHVSLGVELPEPGTAASVSLEAGDLQALAPKDWRVERAEPAGEPLPASAEFLARVPTSADPAQTPYPALRARARLTTGGMTLVLESPVRGFGPAPANSAAVKIEPVSLAPAITVEAGPPLRLLRVSAGESPHEVWVRVENHSAWPRKVSVRLEVPSGWRPPPPQAVELPPDGSATPRLTLTIPKGVAPGSYVVEAVAGLDGGTFRLARRPQPEAGPEPPFVYEPARARVEALDVKVPAGLRIGYIGFNNDPVAALVAQLGVGVDMLDARALAAAKLDAYDAIVIADRAYDYRKDLAEQNARLLDYVKTGGTLVVEHQGRNWDPAKLAPYPGVKPNQNLRVTVESAPVKMLAPAHPVLTFPNRITADDWKGWVQERGLYFWESWAPEYTALVEMADPGEKPLAGSLLAARYGRGTYIYCGLALFRQVRAGVPGGVRLYINLLSQRRAAAGSTEKK